MGEPLDLLNKFFVHHQANEFSFIIISQQLELEQNLALWYNLSVFAGILDTKTPCAISTNPA